MSSPTPVVRGDLIAAVRQAIVDLNNSSIGRGVYRDQADQRATVPYIVLADTDPADALSGDGRPLMQTRVVTASIYQSNGRDANARLGFELAAALHGRRVVVGTESDPTTWRPQSLRCLGRVSHLFNEGFDEQEIAISCYGPPCP